MHEGADMDAEEWGNACAGKDMVRWDLRLTRAMSAIELFVARACSCNSPDAATASVSALTREYLVAIVR